MYLKKIVANVDFLNDVTSHGYYGYLNKTRNATRDNTPKIMAYYLRIIEWRNLVVLRQHGCLLTELAHGKATGHI